MPSRSSPYFSVRLDEHEGSEGTIDLIIERLSPVNYIVAAERGKRNENPHNHIWLEFADKINECTVRSRVKAVLDERWVSRSSRDWAVTCYATADADRERGRRYHCKESVVRAVGIQTGDYVRRAAGAAADVGADSQSVGPRGRQAAEHRDPSSRAMQLWIDLSGEPGWWQLYSSNPADLREIAFRIRRWFRDRGLLQPSVWIVRSYVYTFWTWICEEHTAEQQEYQLRWLADQDIAIN